MREDVPVSAGKSIVWALRSVGLLHHAMCSCYLALSSSFTCGLWCLFVALLQDTHHTQHDGRAAGYYV
jgi:hypothetical protein